MVPIGGHNEGGLAGKVVPTGWRNGGGMASKVVPMDGSHTSQMADHFPHPRIHAFRLPNSPFQAPEATYSGAQTHAYPASYGLTDHWLVQGRRIYVLALPNFALYVHTMP